MTGGTEWPSFLTSLSRPGSGPGELTVGNTQPSQRGPRWPWMWGEVGWKRELPRTGRAEGVPAGARAAPRTRIILAVFARGEKNNTTDLFKFKLLLAVDTLSPLKYCLSGM